VLRIHWLCCKPAQLTSTSNDRRRLLPCPLILPTRLLSPDFTVTNITGKSHKLSNYRGKNVMLIFWATWCGPCRQEIPSFIELKKTVSEDKLAILAISYIDFRSSLEGVKKFVAANPIINYTIITAEPYSLPAPYNAISAIPSTFFINPDGTIKIVAEGLTPLSHIKAILEAEK
jgi:thiol-disulfide isomerase/thioredoxin